MKQRSRSLVPLALASLVLTTQAHETEVLKLTPSDATAGITFGRSLDMQNGVIVAGAPGTGPAGADAGAAYIFSTAGGRFVERAKLTPSDGAAGDAFGRDVAIDFDLVVVGAPRWDGNGQDSGAAYVFARRSEGWVQMARLTPSFAAAGDGFGSAVAVRGDTILVGAPRGSAATGSAYVFARSGRRWIEEAELSAFDGSLGNLFGTSVSLSDNLALVGASLQDARRARSGAAYSFVGASGTWSLDQKFQATDGGTGDLFGQSVVLAGQGVLLIGAPNSDTNGIDAGSAYRFAGGVGAWSLRQQRLGIAPGDLLGGDVDLSYNFGITGCRSYDPAGLSNAGGAALWSSSKSGLVDVIVASDPSDDAQLGGAVAADECWFLAGAIGDAENGKNSGALYVFAPLHSETAVVNGTGTNPLILRSLTSPRIGSSWQLQVDVAGFARIGATEVHVYRQFAPAPIPTPAGEILIDVLSPRMASSFSTTPGLGVHSIEIPADPFLLGLQVAVQGLLRDASTGAVSAYTNGELATFGCELVGID